MVKRNCIADIEKILKEGKDPVEVLNVILRFLNFKPTEIKIYNILLKSSLTIKQIEKQLNLSERTIRKYIKRLEQEGFINKRVKQGKGLSIFIMLFRFKKYGKMLKMKYRKF